LDSAWNYMVSDRDTVKAAAAKSVPYGDLFSVGGIDTVRGFGESELYEKAGQPGYENFPYLRRQTMMLVNVELHFPIADPFRGILFMDMGRSAGRFGADPRWWQPTTWFDQYTDYYTRKNGPPPPHIPFGVSWGPGLRIVIPGTMMLIRFDYGFPIRNGYTFREMLKAGNPAFSIGNLF
jgi:outer membrane protein assembly factor BamA